MARRTHTTELGFIVCNDLSELGAGKEVSYLHIEIDSISDEGERKLLLDINIARSRTAWEVSDRNLVVSLLNRAKNLLFGSSELYKALSKQYLLFGKSLLSNNDDLSVKEALKLMNKALELCERGLSTTKVRDQALNLKGMRLKALRFVAAVHLQGGEFESVSSVLEF